MKKSLRFLAILFILLMPALVYGQLLPSLPGTVTDNKGDYIKVECTCKCNGKDLKSSSIYKKGTETRGTISFILGPIIGPVIGDLLLGYIEEQFAKFRCQETCARSCGGFTDCAEQNDALCNSCCQEYCFTPTSTRGYDGLLKETCKPSCKSTCSYMGFIKGLTEAIYLIAGVIAALMIVIHGIRMVTAQDPSDRNAAKNSIIYVLIALVIIVLAGTLVALLLKPGAIPGT
jgi:hypothetical protein